MAQNKSIIRSVYESFIKGDMDGLNVLLHTSFAYHAPRYLPWGGSTKSLKAYLEEIVPQFMNILDFRDFRYTHVTAEDERVVALIKVGISGCPSHVTICDQWIVEDGKIRSLMSAYFEPLPLLVALEEHKMANHHRTVKWSPY